MADPGQVGLTQGQRDQIQTMLSHPLDFPTEFVSWLEDRMRLLIPAQSGLTSYSDAPPSSPKEGHLWIYRDTSPNATVTWLFRYAPDNTSYPWEFLGGAPAWVGPTDIALTGVNSANGVGFTLPRAGDYVQQVSIREVNCYSGFKYNLMVHDGTTGHVVAVHDQLGGDGTDSMTGQYYWTGKAAATVLYARADKNGGGDVTFSAVSNFVTPKRVS